VVLKLLLGTSVGLAFAIAGCIPNQPKWLPDFEIECLEDWPARNDMNSGTPGVDYGSVWIIRETMPRMQPFAVLWLDDQCGAFTGEGEGSPGHKWRHKVLTLDNEETVDVDCHLWDADDQPQIEFRVDGKQYDVRQGNFFLVSTHGDSISVKQTSRDIGLKGMRFDVDSIVATAKSDQEIRDFFTDAAKGPPSDE
jgi:hypothetical protein